MQQLTVQIPDNKVDFFIDLVANLGFTVENNLQQNTLTSRQKELVEEARARIKDHPEELLDWEEVSKTLRVG